MRNRIRPLAITLTATVLASMAATPIAAAQSSLNSLSSTSSLGSSTSDKTVTTDTEWADAISDGLTVTKIGDLLGRGLSDAVGFYSGDLGTMAPIGAGEEFAIIFGDSFRGHRLGEGQWMSPVGAVARMDDTGRIELIRPLNDGEQVEQLIPYYHNDRGLTLLPSDIININGTLYMQAMWNEGVGNVLSTEIWRSDDNGQTWQSVGKTSRNYMGGMGNLISWEQGPDGYIYVVSSEFKRNDPVYLSRFTLDQIGDRSTWQLYDPTTGLWGSTGKPILDTDVEAGEMNLRYIDGHWVLAMFNEATMAIEVRVSDTIARDWDEIKPANVVIAGFGGWGAEQTPSNFTQLYGAYITPGSTLANMDLVVSQWNTSNNSRYNSTQFNVKGLDTYFGIVPAPPAVAEEIVVQEVPLDESMALN